MVSRIILLRGYGGSGIHYKEFFYQTKLTDLVGSSLKGMMRNSAEFKRFSKWKASSPGLVLRGQKPWSYYFAEVIVVSLHKFQGAFFRSSIKSEVPALCLQYKGLEDNRRHPKIPSGPSLQVQSGVVKIDSKVTCYSLSYYIKCSWCRHPCGDGYGPTKLVARVRLPSKSKL